MPNIGASAAGFGANFGIGLNEVMMFATAITFLFAVISVVSFDAKSGFSVNALGIPGQVLSVFNKLWFNDFAFFKSPDTLSSCSSAIVGINSIGTAVPNMTLMNQTSNGTNIITCNWSDLSCKASLMLRVIFTGPQMGAASPFESMASAVFALPVVGPLFWGFWQLITGMADFLNSCLLGGVRLVIGSAIMIYWGLKLFPVVVVVGAAIWKFTD